MPYSGSEEHTSELQSHDNLVCRLLLEKKTPALRPTRPPPLLPPATTRPTPRVARGGRRGRRARGGAGRAEAVEGQAFFFLNVRATPGFSPFPRPAPPPF